MYCVDVTLSKYTQTTTEVTFWATLYIQGGPKSKPLPNDQILLKPVNDIIFIREIKV